MSRAFRVNPELRLPRPLKVHQAPLVPQVLRVIPEQLVTQEQPVPRVLKAPLEPPEPRVPLRPKTRQATNSHPMNYRVLVMR